MKKYLLPLFALALFVNLHAQDCNPLNNFFEGFEDETFPPECWTYAGNVAYVTTPIFEGEQSLRMWYSSSASSQIVTPRLALSNNKNLRFRYRGNTTSTVSFRVGISYTGNNLSDFIWVSSLDGGYTSWQTYTRNIDPAVKYIIINFTSTTSSHNLYIDNFELEDLPLTQVDWCNLEAPSTVTASIYERIDVTAKVFKTGVTEGGAQGPDIAVWVGYGARGTDPATWINWTTATYVSKLSGHDIYEASISMPTTGEYDFASRVRYSTGRYSYGGYSASGGGFWNGTTHVSGQATITDLQNPCTFTAANLLEGFESTTPFPPVCWTFAGNAGYYANDLTTGFIFAGRQSLRMWYSSSASSRIVTPKLELSNNKTLKFRYRGNTTSTVSFRVGISYTGNNLEDFIWVSDLDGGYTSWQTYSRNIDPAVKYIMINFTSSTSSHNMYIDNFELYDEPLNQVDWCNLEMPPTVTASIFERIEVTAKVFKTGVTEGGAQGPNISVWIGYGARGTNPATWINWTTASYISKESGRDIYQALISMPVAGEYDFASRVRYSNGHYSYGGYSSAGGGFWNGVTNVSGQATITALNSCTFTAANLFEGFESTMPFPPVCWTHAGNAAYYAGDLTTGFIFAGRQSLRMWYSSSASSRIVTPKLELSNNKTLKFRYRANTTSVVSFRVGISYTGNNLEDFIWISDLDGGYTSWQTYSRNIDPSVKYIVINFTSSTSSHNLYIDNFELFDEPLNQVDWCNLESPPVVNASIYERIEVTAKVFKTGITEGGSQGANISVWIGYGARGTNPATWIDWAPATYVSKVNGRDIYRASISMNAVGEYDFASRVRYSNGHYSYGGYSSEGGDFWDGTENVSGQATISNLQTPCTFTANNMFMGFEDRTLPFPPLCWTAAGNVFYRNGDMTTNQIYEGLQSVYMYYSSTPSRIITPRLALNNNKTLKFRYRTGGSTTPFRIGISYTGNNLEDFIWVEERSSSATSWQIYTRNIDPSVKYIAIRHATSLTGTSYYLYIDNFELYDEPLDQVDWCNLETPSNVTASIYERFNVTAKVFKAGVTDGGSQGTGISVWIGYGARGTNPATWTNWTAASYVSKENNRDIYQAPIAFHAAGDYDFVSRVRYNNGHYSYGGYSSEGGGFWNGATNVSGQATVSNLQNPCIFAGDNMFMGFEDMTLPFPPLCWTYAGNVSYFNNDLTSGYIYAGVQSLRMWYSSSTTSRIVTPRLDLNRNKTLRFRYTTNGNTTDFRVGISYTGNNLEDFIWIREVSTSSTSWQTFTEHIDPSVKYITIGFSRASTSPTLYIDNFELYDLPVNQVDWCNLETPASITASIYERTDVLAKVFKTGVTEGGSQGPDISVWVGYGARGTHPSTWSNWTAASYVAKENGRDIYRAPIAFHAAGNYDFASRVRYSTGQYSYGGYSSEGGGFWDGTENVSGQATVSNLQPSCTFSADHMFMGFENSEFPPSCWTYAGNVSYFNNDLISGYIYAGIQSLRIYPGTSSRIVTPRLELNSSKTLKFRYTTNGNTADFRVGVSTTGNNLEDFTWVRTFSTSSTAWQTCTEPIDPSVRYIAINLTSTLSTRSLYIDNFELIAPDLIVLTGVDINADVRPVSVCAGTSENQAIAQLTNHITLRYSDGTTSAVPVTWSIADYNAQQAGSYNATGTFSLPSHISQPIPPILLEVNTTVTVLALPGVVCPNNMTITTKGTFPLSGATPAGGTYSGTGVTGNQFNSNTLENGIYPVTYTFTHPTTQCTNSCTFNITVHILYIAEININNLVPVNVCQGTPLAIVQSQLPAQIEIKDTDNNAYMVNLNWTVPNYDANTAGIYLAEGTFTLPNGVHQTSPETPLIVTTNVNVIALPAVTCPPDRVVDVNTYIHLTGGLPAGGIYSGTGVSGGTIFDATGLSAGFYPVTYTYTDPNTQCTNSCTFVITVRNVGIDELTFSDMKVYPNPTMGILEIESRDLIIHKIEVLDIAGRIVASRPFNILSAHHTIDISHLQSGTYFVKIFTKQGEVVKKVVKQ